MGGEVNDPLDALLAALAAKLAPLLLAAMAPTLPGAPAEIAPLLTKQQLGSALNVSTATIDRGCREGWLPFLLVGDVRRFDLAAVRAALLTRTTGAAVSTSTGVRRLQRPAAR